MRNLYRSTLSTVRSDQRLPMSILVLVTGLVLTLQNPDAQDSAAAVLAKVEVPNLSQVMEWRPGGPPPWMDGDQMLTEEIEELPAIAGLERDLERSRDLRARPQR